MNNQVMNTILERRSVRKFTDQAVGDEELHAICQAAAYAPSAMNRQAWHFTVVSNREKLLRLNAAVKTTMADSDVERIRARSTDGTYNFYYNAPVLIIVSCSPDALYPREDTGCALENIFLAAASLNLGSCWINQLGNGASEAPVVRAVLDEMDVPKNNRVYGCAAIGYPAETVAAKARALDTVNFVK